MTIRIGQGAAVLASALLLAQSPARGAEAEGTTSKDTGQVFLPSVPAGSLVHRQPATDFKPNAAYQWLEVLLEASGRDAVRN